MLELLGSIAWLTQIKIPTKNIVWPSEGLRRVSVNSFGFGGSNTHVILDDVFHYLRDRELVGNHCTIALPGDMPKVAPASNGIAYINGAYSNEAYRNGEYIHGSTPSTNGTGRHIPNGTNGTKQVNGATGVHRQQPNGNTPSGSKHRLLVLTAADERALGRMIHSHDTFYKNVVSNDPVKVDRLAFTLAARRTHMLWRTFTIVDDSSENRGMGFSAATPIRTSIEGGLAFIFTGQGAQYVKMGMELLQYQVFETTLQEVDDIYARLGCEWSIFGEIYLTLGKRNATDIKTDEILDEKNIHLPEYSQPISTALQIALVELLKSFGVVPKAVVGHSSGEIAAAYVTPLLEIMAVPF